MEKKDYFSQQAKAYAAFRPSYPEALYRFIFDHLENYSCAWDCATGNGQVAQYLACHFSSVYATDISQQQIDNAFPAKNIFYSVAGEENTIFKDNQFDLITVAQALHWFNRPGFYREVKRTAKTGGLLAVWGYALLSVEPAIDKLFMDFYTNQIGPYWDDARKLVESYYRDISFPFEQIACPEFNIIVNWTSDQFTGYLTSWSATQKYIRTHGIDPVESFKKDLKSVWKSGEVKQVTFPVFMKLGRI
ncbi:MAG: class I SAM-dependent methyltransferase [Cyclobacteriaceae bacterium]